MAYRVILFDLFDTLVTFDRERLPQIQVNGRTVRSTAGRLHAIFVADVPGVTLEVLYEALVGSWQEAERRRAADHREVPARERFHDLIGRLGLQADTLPDGLIDRLLEGHRRGLVQAVEFPAHHGPLLRSLAARYRLGVVSNFDYTPTALGILEGAGVRGLFEAIVVSDAVGWRKPAPAIFHEALRRTGAAPHEALFIGDRADIDVAGAQRVGMEAVWLNRSAESLPPDATPPRYEIRDLAELRGILGV